MPHSLLSIVLLLCRYCHHFSFPIEFHWASYVGASSQLYRTYNVSGLVLYTLASKGLFYYRISGADISNNLKCREMAYNDVFSHSHSIPRCSLPFGTS